MTDAAATHKPDGLESVTLHGAHDGLEAAWAPGANLVLHSLKLRGRELLGQKDGLSGYAERAKTMGIPLLHPWANRLSRFGYRAAGRLVTLDRANPRFPVDPNGLPIHGALPSLLRWEVVATEADNGGARMHARLGWASSHPAFGLFPYPHRLDYYALVTERSVRITVRLASTEEQPVPVSFGFHPYLRIPSGPRANAQITLPVRRRLVLDESMIPTGETEPFKPGRRSLGASTWDDGFCDLPPAARFVVSSGDREVSLTFLRGYPFAQVYAPAGSDFVCFEPMTAPTNALVRGGPDLKLAAPGERYEAGFELAVAS
jgi:galactose mutarotase-like enzyme